MEKWGRQEGKQGMSLKGLQLLVIPANERDEWGRRQEGSGLQRTWRAGPTTCVTQKHNNLKSRPWIAMTQEAKFYKTESSFQWVQYWHILRTLGVWFILGEKTTMPLLKRNARGFPGMKCPRVEYDSCWAWQDLSFERVTIILSKFPKHPWLYPKSSLGSFKYETCIDHPHNFPKLYQTILTFSHK